MRQVVVVALALVIGTSVVAESASVEDLAWLAGCWAMDGAEAGSVEQWTRPAGGTLLGVSRTVKSSATVAYEFLLIRESENGGIELVAHPSGQRQAVFTLAKLSEHEVVFENPDHDFPQRILYRLRGDELRGRIEGEVEGKARAADFPMTREACGSKALGLEGQETPE